MQDKRAAPRKKLITFTPVYSLNPKSLIGYLEDLTTQGAKLVGSVPLEADKLITLSINFPKDTTSLPATPFTIHARVAQSHMDEANYENIGLEFLDVTEEQVAVLEAVIQRYDFHLTQ